MSMYYKSGIGVEYDELIGGSRYPQYITNVKLSAGESVERGDLLVKLTSGEYVKPTDATGEVYGIAVNASSDVATVYQAGEFNRNAINCKSTVNISDIEDKLRMQGIYVTKSAEVK